MPAPAFPRLMLALSLAIAGAALTACGGSDDPGSSGTDVSVTAKDDSCEVADTSLDAGKVTFAVQNEGSKVTEVYVYGEAGSGEFTKVVSEVENIGPGTGRDMTVSLSAGSYEVACKPGQTGDGIRQKVTVTGDGGGASTESESEEGYDREIELTVNESGLSGLDPATATATEGERIELKLENELGESRTLELVSPSGNVSAEVEVPAGQEGEAIVELSETGDWTVKVEGGPKDIEHTLTVS